MRHLNPFKDLVFQSSFASVPPLCGLRPCSSGEACASPRSSEPSHPRLASLANGPDECQSNPTSSTANQGEEDVSISADAKMEEGYRELEVSCRLGFSPATGLRSLPCAVAVSAHQLASASTTGNNTVPYQLPKTLQRWTSGDGDQLSESSSFQPRICTAGGSLMDVLRLG